ncbi:MAG TPA: hypothetical protein VGH10_09145 [Actinomycetota bacterium]|jgi:hypothetical protein
MKRWGVLVAAAVIGAAIAPGQIASASSGAGAYRQASSIQAVPASGTASQGPSAAAQARFDRFAAQQPLYAHPVQLAGAKQAVARRMQAAASAATSGAAHLPVVKRSWNGVYSTDVVPPDTTGAVGPSSYIETVNVKAGIYSRTGSVITSGSLNTLLGAGGDCVTDPQMKYDANTGIFYYVALGVGNFFPCGQAANNLYIGWSKTSNPTGLGTSNWCKFIYAGYGSEIADYPKLGDTQSFFVVGANIYDDTGSDYLGSDVLAFAKPTDPGTCTSPLPGTKFSNITVPGSGTLIDRTPVPVVQTDPSDTGYVVAADFDGVGVCASGTDKTCGTHVAVFTVGNSGGTPTLSAATLVNVTRFDVPPNAPQKGVGVLIDTLDGRLTQATSGVDPNNATVDAAGAIWTQHAIFGGAGSKVRWYEIDPNAGTEIQEGNASSSKWYVFNGAIAPDRSFVPGGTSVNGGDMVVGVSTSSTSTYPAIRMVSKLGGAGQSAFVFVKGALGLNRDFSCVPPAPGFAAVCRWGDYSGASPDPVASASGHIWLANQYNVASQTKSDVDTRTFIWEATP